MNKLELLRRNMSWSEEQVLALLARTIPNGGAVVVGNLSVEHGIKRSTAVIAVQKASIAGIIDHRSMGTKGCMIRVLDKQAWDELAKLAKSA